MEESKTVRYKSKQFAIRIVRFVKYLHEEKKCYFDLSRQILRSGTSIGANVHESKNAQSRDDFIHKLSVALKEADETAYWLEVLYGAEIIEQKEFESLCVDLKEIIALLTSIIRTTKE
ncbi:MAG: four helix bundle protein [Tidjanibacter sp.]|nr:four helix bundle protein [Tidjanibacter sp.]